MTKILNNLQLKLDIPKYLQTIKFISKNIKRKPIITNNISLFIDNSCISTLFINNENKGLFTNEFISKGTILFDQTNIYSKMMNDPMINLNDLYNSVDSLSYYTTWTNMYNRYHNINIIKDCVNIRMLIHNDHRYYQALRDIQPGEELVKMYGFTTWIVNNIKLLTNKNICGFLYFIKDILPEIKGAPFYDKILNFNKLILNSLFDKSIYELDIHKILSYYIKTLSENKTSDKSFTSYYLLQQYDTLIKNIDTINLL